MAAHISRHLPCISFRRDRNRPVSHGMAPSDSEPKRSEHGTSGNGSTGSQNDLACQAVNLTARQQEVLGQLRMGESNKTIARRLGMTEGTVKVHIRQMMRKCHAANRTQLALGRAAIASTVDDNLLTAKSVEKKKNTSFTEVSSTHQEQALPLISPTSRGRLRYFGSH